MTENRAALAALQRLADAAATDARTQVRVALGKDFDLVRTALEDSTPDPRPRQAGLIEVSYTAEGFSLRIDGWQLPWSVRSIGTQLDGLYQSWPGVQLELEADRVTVEHSQPWPRICGTGTACMLPPGHPGPHQPQPTTTEEGTR